MSEYIEFNVDDAGRFVRLATIFVEIKKDKDSNNFRPDEDWPQLFDAESHSRFHWPTKDERNQRLEDIRTRPTRIMPTEQMPGMYWDFFCMIDAFKDGEYELKSCDQIAPGKARMQFHSLAYPYGGVGCMVALIEAFGFKITGIEDGTGYMEVP
jgi:hypothetical protein